MLPNQNPNGLVIQAQGVGDRAELIRHCVASNYATVTVLDEFSLAQDIKNALPNCIVVYRSSKFEPLPSHANPVGALIALLNSLPQDQRIVVMVDCEQGYSIQHVNMWAAMIEVADSMGWKLCVGNVSSGSVKSGQGTEPNDWLLARNLFEVMARLPGHYLGIHEYTPFFPWIVSNDRFNAPHEKPSAIDWTLNQWHIGRFIQGIMRACVELDLPFPQVIVTECLIDDMELDWMYAGYDSGGWQGLIELWKQLFPGKDAQDVLTEFHKWAWEVVYAPVNFVVGLHTYTYGDASDYPKNRWKKYRVDTAKTYRSNMEGYRPAMATTPTTPEVLKPLIKGDSGVQSGKIKPTSGGVNLRLKPATAGNKPVGSLVEERKCLYKPDIDSGWALVTFTDTMGGTYYVSIGVVTFTEDAPTQPVPEQEQRVVLNLEIDLGFMPVSLANAVLAAWENAKFSLKP